MNRPAQESCLAANITPQPVANAVTPPPTPPTSAPATPSKSQRNSDLTELFTTAHDKFVSPAGIHASLSELFTLLAENRVAPRRAAVLAYIGSLMLRTLPAIQQEVAAEMAAAKAKNAKPANLWNYAAGQHATACRNNGAHVNCAGIAPGFAPHFNWKHMNNGAILQLTSRRGLG